MAGRITRGGNTGSSDITASVDAVEAAVDLTTAAVDLTTTAVDLTTTAVNLVTAAVDLTTAAVDSATTAIQDSQSADGAAGPGKVTYIGGRAESSVRADVDAGDNVPFSATLNGRQIMAGYNDTDGVLDINVANQAALTVNAIQIIDELLDADPTSSESSPVYIGDVEKISLLIVSDVTAVGAAPQVTYTFEGSNDGTVYEPFYVISQEDNSMHANYVHDSDSEQWCYLQQEFKPLWIKVIATGANTDADDTVACDVYLVGKKG